RRRSRYEAGPGAETDDLAPETLGVTEALRLIRGAVADVHPGGRAHRPRFALWSRERFRLRQGRGDGEHPEGAEGVTVRRFHHFSPPFFRVRKSGHDARFPRLAAGGSARAVPAPTAA